ncbi:MAG: tetratricopeptide repeat protein [Saprospiraceae bacterium]|nr:tetratricopeptide repeat protein [Candidatus Vicinibacter affinis]
MKYIVLIMLLPFLAFSQNKPASSVGRGASPLGTKTEQSTSGATYAVVVGISDYQDKDIPDLRYADKDAEAFANFLRSEAGGKLDKDHLKMLLNKEATMAQFANALDWLWENVKEGDQAIIYFSGHGDVEKKSLTQPGFLLCWDAPARVYMAGGAFALPMLQEVISTLSIQNKAKVIVITDACRSGKLAGNSVGGAQATASNLSKQFANEIKILSCQPNEYSIEGEQWGGGRGAFSFNLVNALYGLADNNKDLSITLQEIGRYLEDHVTTEVAPVSQLPMVLGNRNEKIATVKPDILASIQTGKSNQMAMLSAIDSKGIEEDVITTLDTSTKELYRLFKKAIVDKDFLKPDNACADFYYRRLISDTKMQRLHSTITRNYAAALQDDAQQVMNIMLKTGLTSEILSGAKAAVIYRNYPAYLARAAQLLGSDHYMFATLQARKHYFEGVLQTKEVEKKQQFFQALHWQPAMPHAYAALISIYEVDQIDSAEYYTRKAMEITPAWVKPYLNLSSVYLKAKQFDKEEEMLNRATKVDSNSILVWYAKARFYQSHKNFEKAEYWFKKMINSSGEDICFPCTHNNLGYVYKDTHRYDEAEQQYKKVIQLDSTFNNAYYNLGIVYMANQRYTDAEQVYKKLIQLDTNKVDGYMYMGILYNVALRYKELEQLYKKVIQLDSTFVYGYQELGNLYQNTQRYTEAEHQYKKTLQLDSTFLHGYYGLANLYYKIRRYGDATPLYKKAIELNPTYTDAYLNLGNLYRATRRYGEAEQEYIKIIKIDSTAWMAYANLAQLYQKLLRWEESVAMIQKSILYGPKIAILTAILGNAFTHIPARFQDAETTLQKALEMEPADSDTYIYLAQLALKNKQADLAWKYFEQGLEKGIDNGEFMLDYLLGGDDFEGMRKEERWKELMKKYFLDKFKD